MPNSSKRDPKSEPGHAPDEPPGRSDTYREARDAFDALGFDDRAVFLLEATVSTIARGVQAAGQAFAEAVEEAAARADAERERRRAQREAWYAEHDVPPPPPPHPDDPTPADPV